MSEDQSGEHPTQVNRRTALGRMAAAGLLVPRIPELAFGDLKTPAVPPSQERIRSVDYSQFPDLANKYKIPSNKAVYTSKTYFGPDANTPQNTIIDTPPPPRPNWGKKAGLWLASWMIVDNVQALKDLVPDISYDSPRERYRIEIDFVTYEAYEESYGKDPVGWMMGKGAKVKFGLASESVFTKIMEMMQKEGRSAQVKMFRKNMHIEEAQYTVGPDGIEKISITK